MLAPVQNVTTKARRRSTHHLCKSTRGHNVPRMHQTVKMTSRFLNLLSKIIVGIEVEDVGHKVKGILIVWDLGVEPREVESIGQVILVNLTEILVTSRRDELQRSNRLALFIQRIRTKPSKTEDQEPRVCGAHQSQYRFKVWESRA